jgi:hypothetical protein
MKIAGLFSGESLMSLALTTTHENGIYRGVSGGFVRQIDRAKKPYCILHNSAFT